jgi:hypothetical protein
MTDRLEHLDLDHELDLDFDILELDFFDLLDTLELIDLKNLKLRKLLNLTILNIQRFPIRSCEDIR